MENIKCSEKVTNEETLGSIGEKRTLLSNILRRKPICIVHILTKNVLFLDALEEQMGELKEIGRRTTEFLDDLRNRRRY